MIGPKRHGRLGPVRSPVVMLRDVSGDFGGPGQRIEVAALHGG